MTTGTGAGGSRIERELLVVIAIAVLVPVIGVIYSAVIAGSANQAPALVSAPPTATAAALTPTPEATPLPTPTPFIPARAEYGVAAVALER
ncbi:MAG: hypothetical protein O3B31_02360, partial [Chloroflexi bacterium]|nr:hypothetical protein [Chloroflexota bacterium]